jgi:hypothetical protein
MAYKIEFTINDTPATINQFLAKGWKARWAHSKKWQMLIDTAILKAGGYPDAPLRFAKVKLIRYSTKKLDRDNLVGSFKPVLDALKTQKARDAKVLKNGKLRPAKSYIGRALIDDTEEHVFVEYGQEPTKRGQKFIYVSIEESTATTKDISDAKVPHTNCY